MSKRRQRLQAEIGAFLKQYGRKAHAGHNSNDRQFDRKIQGLIRRMSPAELDEMMNGIGEDESEHSK